MSTRKRSIPFKIASLLLLPLLCILALTVFAASHALGEGWFALDVAAAGVGILGVAGSIAIAVRISRKISSDARMMTAGVYDFSQRRLPMISERVRQGIDTHGSFDAPDYFFSTQEIQTLLEAFIFARDAAVKATVDEGSLRKGIGEVFVNLARRSQALVHRQLTLLDAMERRANEPEELEDLFRLDHLATRMRRHAEGLVILSGRAPARGWRNPVPFIDVARGAVGEIEDYPRVTVAPMSGPALTGRAVADVIHLLAELIENATSFSPPHTSVQVNGQAVGNGFVIEVEDRGLGMSKEQLESVNKVLADPPVFDLSESARLGLFVVGHLAKRQGLKVSLRPSPYGGTTAIILIPSSLVVDADAAEEFAAPPAGSAAVAGAASRSVGAAPAPAPASATSTSAATGGRLRPAPAPPAADRPPLASRQPGRHAQSPRPHRPAEDRPASPKAVEAELPRRVRQENLAPQLRQDASASSEGPTGDTGGTAETDRSPEDIRATMAALQNGWLRGRREGDAAGEDAKRTSGRPEPEAGPADERDA